MSATLHTTYPGLRRATGGGYGLERALSHFLPTTFIQGHQPLTPGTNICEASVLGSYFVLMAAFFIDGRQLLQAARSGHLRRVWVLAGAAVLMAAWLFLPLPAWVGMPLLWDRVPPPRMAFAFGFILLLLAHEMVESAGARITVARTLAFAAAVIGAYLVFKRLPHGISIERAWLDLAVVLPVT